MEEDLTGVLPPDGVSKDGFVNNGQAMLLSPLLVETHFEIAERGSGLSGDVDPNVKPVIQNFRVDLGHEINLEPCLINLSSVPIARCWRMTILS